MLTDAGAGAGDPFDPWDLADMRERVLLPVVGSLIRPDELSSVSVAWGPPVELGRASSRSRYPDAIGDVVTQPEEELWARVEAGGEVWFSVIWDPDTGPLESTLGEVGARIADQLEDWISETRFAWGQRRSAQYSIPARPEPRPR